MIRLDSRPLHLLRSTLLASSLVLAAGFTSASAQQTSASTPSLNLQLPADTARETLFSSSSADNQVAVAENHFDFVAAARDAAQPPPRRGYNRPRYRGGNTNPDGSPKYDFFIGGGLTQPVGNTYHYLTPSWGFQLGGGRNYDKNFAMNLQFDWDNFGFTGRTISSQSLIYFGQTGVGLDGNSHVWSLTVDPTYTLNPEANLSMYVVGGVGFFHKTANFTIPATGTYCDYFGYCYSYQANQTIDKYTSNAPGFDGGFGLTYKLSKFSNQRFYGEVRYVYVANTNKPGYTLANINSAPANATNLFPANSHRTTYFPIKFGLRF